MFAPSPSNMKTRTRRAVSSDLHKYKDELASILDLKSFTRLLDLYPTGILSVVSDTWDFWSVITNVLPKLRDKILSRKGKLVIRPDSGDPVKILVGDPSAQTEQERKGLIECLWDIFGGITNSRGYRVLHPTIGAIYGDSITLDRQKQILEGLKQKGLASTNIVLGIGSYTYQYITRDTFGFAIKATYAIINDHGTPLFKAPKTDNGVKNSMKGLPFINRRQNKYVLYENATWSEFISPENALEPIFTDGKLLVDENLSMIKDRIGLWTD